MQMLIAFLSGSAAAAAAIMLIAAKSRRKQETPAPAPTPTTSPAPAPAPSATSGADTIEEHVIENISFTDIFDLNEIQRIQDAFAKATNVASIITDVDGVPITAPSNFCRLCRDIIRKCPKGLKNCMHSDAVLGKSNPDGPIVQPCLSGGLWDGGASIHIGKRHIANWLIGQVRNERQDESKMLEYAKSIDADVEEFRKALAEVPVMSVEQFENVCSCLFITANQLSSLAYHNLMQTRAINALEKTEKALKKSENNLKIILDSIGDAVIGTSLDGVVSSMNAVAQSLTGCQLPDAHGKPLDSVYNKLDFIKQTPIPVPVNEVLNSNSLVRFATPSTLISADGSVYTISDRAAPIMDAGGTAIGMVLVFNDITREQQLEDQLRQSQKMDAVGKLAGGIAHDFNNILHVILGYGDILGRKISDPQQRKLLSEVINAGNSARQLVMQLLTFSRAETRCERQCVDLNSLVSNFRKLISRILEENIKLNIACSPDPLNVSIDPGQIEQVLMNLCVNARDAMPGGGSLSIHTSTTTFSPHNRPPCLIPDGSYACCEISDTGTGIPREIQNRVFEPFFTTKAVGHGTGLGLATSYAIIQKHQGGIVLESTPGRGTTFRLLIPLCQTETSTESPQQNSTPYPDPSLGRNRGILVVEDEEQVRAIARNILEESGFKVIEAATGTEGIRLFQLHCREIKLAIIDVILPEASGKEVAEHIRRASPDTPVIFSSGYTNEQISAGDISEHLLHKPYQGEELISTIRKILP